MTIQEEIETALTPLLGEPLSDMWRIAGMQRFEIGVQRPCKNRKGQDITRADMALHVQCGWCIKSAAKCVVSSEDIGPGNTRRDEKAWTFYGMLGGSEFIIHSIRANNNGDVVLRMTGGCELHLLTDHDQTDANPDADTEQWRFLPKDEDTRHFVITADGIERY